MQQDHAPIRELKQAAPGQPMCIHSQAGLFFCRIFSLLLRCASLMVLRRNSLRPRTCSKSHREAIGHGARWDARRTSKDLSEARSLCNMSQMVDKICKVADRPLPFSSAREGILNSFLPTTFFNALL
ncbi:MAG: hypothetical protein Q4A28_04330 [Brachymonas sp.]|nr:hypothetical protein [Brachymonas sp.]